MRGCALRKVVRNLAHEKLENRGVEPQHLPSQIPRPAPTGRPPGGWGRAEKPGAERAGSLSTTRWQFCSCSVDPHPVCMIK